MTAEGSGLLIKSLPPAAKVYVDGIERGYTPLLLDNINPGIHTLLLTKDRYKDWSSQITVSSQERLEALIDLIPLTGKITVNLIKETTEEPAFFEPHIFLDGVEQESEEFDAPAGWHTVKASVFGREDAQKTILVGDNENIIIDFELKRAVFEISGLRLSRSAFNPVGMRASGVVTVDFNVNAPGSGLLKVLDDADNVVFVSAFDSFKRSGQRYVWNGKNQEGGILADGNYRIEIDAEDSESNTTDTLSITVKIDSTLDDQPLTLISAQPGLLFVPFSITPSKGGFQIETSLAAGMNFDALMFSAALCFTPLDTWQFAAAVNIHAGKDGSTDASAAGSAKKELVKPAGLIPGIAVAISYRWAADNPMRAFGVKPGIQIYTPFSWRIAGGGLFLNFAPSVIWMSKDGLLQEALPHFAVSKGILYNYKIISVGLSGQSVIGLDDFYAAAAELRFTPWASNLSIGLQAGASFSKDKIYWSGGLSIGAFF
jgi:hypothetical protein